MSAAIISKGKEKEAGGDGLAPGQQESLSSILKLY